LEEKWQLKAKKISHYGVLFLFSTLMELRAEGYADFSSRDLDGLEINKKKIVEFKKNLWKLVKKTKREDAEAFFEKKISTESYASYYAGNVMCAVIALYFSKGAVSLPRLMCAGREFPATDLNKLLNTKKNISIRGIPKEIRQKTLSYVSSTGPVEFLNMYNEACEHFGVSYDNRVLWWQEFIKLKQKTTEIAEAARRKKIAKKGYKA
jgi:hypothetical protein